MSQASALVDKQGPLAIVRLNRPERLNALDFGATRRFCEVMADVLADQAVRAVLMTGAGRAFCAGADLAELTNPLDVPDAPVAGELLRRFSNPLIEAMVGATKPIVAAVNGPAVGVGCSIAFAADLVLAAESATFVQGFAKLGAVPDAGSTWLLPRLVGHGRARSMMLLGEPVGAHTALGWGLVQKVTLEEDLWASALALATSLANGPTSAYAAIKRLSLSSYDFDLQRQMSCEAAAQEAAFSTADFSEGVRARLNRCEPQFKGKWGILRERRWRARRSTPN